MLEQSQLDRNKAKPQSGEIKQRSGVAVRRPLACFTLPLPSRPSQHRKQQQQPDAGSQQPFQQTLSNRAGHPERTIDSEIKGLSSQTGPTNLGDEASY